MHETTVKLYNNFYKQDYEKVLCFCVLSLYTPIITDHGI